MGTVCLCMPHDGSSASPSSLLMILSNLLKTLLSPSLHVETCVSVMKKDKQHLEVHDNEFNKGRTCCERFSCQIRILTCRNSA